MDTISSAEFRRAYAKLLRPTVVTVNGHAIGVWQPHKGPHEDAWRDALGVEPVPVEVDAAVRTFSSRPFTPVPKRR